MKELTIGFLLETNKGSHIDEDLTFCFSACALQGLENTL